MYSKLSVCCRMRHELLQQVHDVHGGREYLLHDDVDLGGALLIQHDFELQDYLLKQLVQEINAAETNERKRTLAVHPVNSGWPRGTLRSCV